MEITPRTRLIAGVSVPESPLIREVLEYAQKLSEPYLFNHAMRSWLFAAKIGHIKAIDCDDEVVAVGTILHDIGLTDSVSGSKSLRGQWRRRSAVVHQRTRPLGSPRTAEMKHRFSETCRHLVTARPETTYDNFLRDFGERFVPGYKTISTVDLLMNAPFEE